jgi:hypothetical protein
VDEGYEDCVMEGGATPEEIGDNYEAEEGYQMAIVKHEKKSSSSRDLSKDDEDGESSGDDYKLSDIEDYQQDCTGGGASALLAGGGATIIDYDMDEEPGDGEQQLDALANRYMMKSPVTMAMRKSSVHGRQQ